MEMKPITSSNVSAAGYDAARGVLRVQFKSGTYEYDGVPEEVFAALLAAPSAGKFINAEVKDKYSMRRL